MNTNTQSHPKVCVLQVLISLSVFLILSLFQDHFMMCFSHRFNSLVCFSQLKWTYSVLCLVQAVDRDLDANVTYRIRSVDARQMFALSPLTGELKVLRRLDFEELLPDGTTHTFVVEAADGGSGNMPPGLASVTVTITVRECPSFPRLM